MLKPPLTADQLSIICRETEAAIHSLVAAQSAGRIDEREFVVSLLVFEAENATAHGLTLTVSHTFDDWSVASLRLPGRSEPCVSFEFQPGTGCFREVGTACRESDPQLLSTVISRHVA
jgi:hypothetical protein